MRKRDARTCQCAGVVGFDRPKATLDRNWYCENTAMAMIALPRTSSRTEDKPAHPNLQSPGCLSAPTYLRRITSIYTTVKRADRLNSLPLMPKTMSSNSSGLEVDVRATTPPTDPQARAVAHLRGGVRHL